ncbi:CNNM domain-containing protein [Halobacillus shinanisalinarum]|uniref:CNNM domain-containing protein n=1 Tax=Halobacillus shinanisalinarum TaxID=2932258 RepID=A0ABY4GWZ4_9BACI|nr:CNNM domain-containing protein [Halobacillus shinanisalinarum]UOQ92696.1 CNNM domain-containing protein [Halobacillus shinanisalinarum]
MIIAIIFLLFVSFFFSGSETALTATNKMRLQTKAGNNDRKAEKLLHLVSKPGEFITTILIGNNISNILLPTLVTTLAIQYGFNVGLASAILTVTIIIFSEVIPKSVAAAFPDRIALLVSPIIRFFVVVFKPVTIVLNRLTGIITKALAKDQPNDVSISKEELRTMVDIADSEGTFNQAESHRIKGVLDFYNLNVKDVLKTPRVELTALPSTASFEVVRDVVIQNPFTRYPVYKEDIDDIVAVFHSKYLLSWSTEQGKPLEAFSYTDPLIIYEFHPIEWVFRKMTKEKKHMAIVLDEYGGTEGILTHEDIIEAMIGLEIEDEMDLESEAIVEKVTDTEIICDGKITLRRLNSIFNSEIPEEEDVLAGYLLKEFNDFPEEGEVLERVNLTFKVLETEGRTIRKVLIIK